MYVGVPIVVPGLRQLRTESTAFAMPKSVTCTLPRVSIEDVRGLHVAVDDAVVVRVLKRRAELQQKSLDDRDRQRPWPRTTASSGAPSTYFMTKNSGSPASRTE